MNEYTPIFISLSVAPPALFLYSILYVLYDFACTLLLFTVCRGMAVINAGRTCGPNPFAIIMQ